MPWVRIFSVFFPSFLRSSSVCAVAAAAEKNRTAAADAKNFMRSPWAKIRADHVSSSSASARPEAVMLHLQRLAVNSPGRPLYLEAGVGLESRFVEEDVMHEMKRRDFIRGATLGALAFTVGGGPILLTAREARAQGVPFRLLKASEADTLEALGETLVPGARAAGISHFIDQQLSVPPEDAQLNTPSQREFVDLMRQGKLDGWQGPPAPFIYFVTRSDAVDVVYGTVEGYESLGIPYMPHIAPEKRW